MRINRPRTTALPRSRWSLLGAAALTALALACGSDGPESAPIPDNSPLAGAPEWVLQGCTAYWGDDDGARARQVHGGRQTASEQQSPLQELAPLAKLPAT